MRGQLARGVIAVGLIAVGLIAWAPLAQAADPSAVQTPIKGTDVMGDKGRSGPDGWVWAPQTRDQAPTDKSKQSEANAGRDLNSQPGPDTGKKLAPGDDPGTPAATDAHGPGTMDSAHAHKP